MYMSSYGVVIWSEYCRLSVKKSKSVIAFSVATQVIQNGTCIANIIGPDGLEDSIFKKIPNPSIFEFVLRNSSLLLKALAG